MGRESRMNFRIINKQGRFYAEVEKKSWFRVRWYPALLIAYTMEGEFNRPFDTEKECRAELNKEYFNPDLVVWEGAKP